VGGFHVSSTRAAAATSARAARMAHAMPLPTARRCIRSILLTTTNKAASLRVGSITARQQQELGPQTYTTATLPPGSFVAALAAVVDRKASYPPAGGCGMALLTFTRACAHARFTRSDGCMHMPNPLWTACRIRACWASMQRRCPALSRRQPHR
jgi:hypothetical protein